MNNNSISTILLSALITYFILSNIFGSGGKSVVNEPLKPVLKAAEPKVK